MSSPRSSSSAPSRIRRRRLLSLVAVGSIVGLGVGCTDDAAWSGPATNPSAPDGSAPDGSATAVTADRAIADSFGELDRIVGSAMDATGTPGVAVAVVHGDDVLYTQGYGVRSTATGQPVSEDTVFQIASMSKPISSTVMSGLVGEDVIEWDEPIATSGPTSALGDPWVSERVTYADLFSHRSGLPGGTAGNDLEAIGYDRTTILERLPQVPLESFRDQFSYSNWGMTLGGAAAAEAAGTTWEQLADDLLFTPAGMDRTSMRHEDFVAAQDRAELHVRGENGWESVVERQPETQAPAGGVSSTVADLAQWVRLQLADGSLEGEQIIDAEALDATHAPAISRGGPAPTDDAPASFYGLGWNVGTDAHGRLEWNHSGAFSAGASTVVKIVPGNDLGIVVLTNGEPVGVPEAIADAYLEYLHDGEVTTDWLALWGDRFAGVYGEPIDTTPPADPTPALEPATYLGTYSNDYVGSVEIVEGPDGLEALMGPDALVVPLRHLDANTFTYLDAPELPDFPATAKFAVDADADGTASTLTLSSLDGSGLGTLTRT